MRANYATVVQVRDAWRGCRTAEVDVNDLEDVHWWQPPGAPRSIVHAYVLCSRLTGDIPHDCTTKRQPHRLRVCVLKRSVAPSVHDELARRADNRQDVPSVEARTRQSVLTRAPRETAAFFRPWLWVAAGGGLVLAVMLARRRGPRVAVPASAGCRSTPKEHADTVAA
jgi:hypothetical protein